MQYGAACNGNAVEFLWSHEPGVTQASQTADAPRFRDARICRRTRAARNHAVANLFKHARRGRRAEQPVVLPQCAYDAVTAAAANTAFVAAAAAVGRQSAGENLLPSASGASLSPNAVRVPPGLFRLQSAGFYIEQSKINLIILCTICDPPGPRRSG